MKQLRLITSVCFVILSAGILSSCSVLPQQTPQNNVPATQTASENQLTATLEIESVSQASFSAALRYMSNKTIPLSGVAIRLQFPKQNFGKDIEPFIILESTRAKFWQPLINQLDCESDPNNCFADLALLTLSPNGSDFEGLDSIVGLNPTIFSSQVLKNTDFDSTNSVATTKKAEIITLDLRNAITTE